MPKLKTTGETGLLTTLRDNKLGVRFRADVSFEEWSRFGDALTRADSALMWVLGDWLVCGEAHKKAWGEKYTAVLAATGYSYQTGANALWVANAIEFSLRREKLSFEHHKVVAHLDGKGKAGLEYWLAVAEKHGLSTRELAASVKHGKVMRLADLHALAEDNKGIFTPEGVRSAFQRSFAEASKLRPVGEWPAKQRAVWKAQLQPIVDLYRQL
jgi:hypothetical protein